jgi:hypothetical protein
MSLEIDVGAVASVAGDTASAGGTLGLWLSRADSTVAGRVALLASLKRDETLGGGHASWSHAELSAGVSYRQRSPRWTVDLHADVVGALLWIEGVGYMTTDQSYAFDPGVGLGLRLLHRRTPIAPWFDISGIGWLRRQQAVVDGVGEVLDLPRYELLISAGLAFRGEP